MGYTYLNIICKLVSFTSECVCRPRGLQRGICNDLWVISFLLWGGVDYLGGVIKLVLYYSNLI